MKTVGEDGTAAVELALGQAYKAQNKLDLAIQHYQKSLAIEMKTVGESGCVVTYNALASVFNSRCDYGTAVLILQKTVAILKRCPELPRFHMERCSNDLAQVKKESLRQRGHFIETKALECDTCRILCEPNFCVVCQVAKYCSKECQKMAWKAGHKATCKSKV